MNNVQKSLLQLLSASIRNDISVKIDLKEEEWEQLYKEAKAHEVHLIIYNLYNYSVGENLQSVQGSSLKKYWKKINLLTQLCLEARLTVIKQVLSDLKSNGIEVIVLKGLYIRSLYPQEKSRTMGDIDLLVKKIDLERAVKVLEAIGYKKSDQDNNMHVNLSHEKYINIELHYAASRSDILSKAADFNHELWNSCKRVRLYDVECLIPSDINHIIFCCLHMANHFKYCGFGLRQLCDLVVLLEGVYDGFEWDDFLSKVRRYGIGTFTEAILIICSRYLKLYIPVNILREISGNDTYISLLIDEILSSGVFGLKSKARVSNNALANYLLSENGNEKKIRVLRYLFPPRNKLCDTYSYAKNHFILIPVAWIHRIIQNILRTDLRLLEKKPDTEHIKNHIKLVKWLSIK